MKSSGMRGMVGLALGLGAASSAMGEILTTLDVARELRYIQDAPTSPQPGGTAPILDGGEKDWTVVAVPGAWLPWYVEGEGIVKDVSADVQIQPSQLWDDVDTYAGNIRLEFWNADGWGIFGEIQTLSFDGDEFSLTASGTPLITRASLEINHFMADLGAGFRIIDAPETTETEGWGALDLFAGVRFQSLDQEIYASPSSNVKDSQTFFEPMFGLRALIGINESVAVTLRGDWSGFYVGDGSDFTWTLQGGVVTRVNRNFDLHFAYRIFEIDYLDDDGLDTFGINMTFSGPYFGGVIQF